MVSLINNFYAQYKILFPYIRKHTSKLILASILTIITSLSILPLPLLTKRFIDHSIKLNDSSEIIYIGIIIIMSTIVLNAIGMLQQKLFFNINQQIIRYIKQDVLSKIFNAPWRIINERGWGYYMSRVEDDTERISELFIDNLLNVASQVITLIVGLTACAIMYIELTIYLLPFIPLYCIASIHYNKKLTKTLGELFEKKADHTEQLNESLHIASICKSSSDFSYPQNRYANTLSKYIKSLTRYFHIQIWSDFTITVIGGFITVTIFVFGGLKVINGLISLGTLIAFNSFFTYVTNPIESLVRMIFQLKKASVSFERISEIFSLPQEIPEMGNIDKHDIHNIALENVSVMLNERYILQSISMNFVSGDRVLITGPSGSGKTTLLRTIIGIVEYTDGLIRINGKVAVSKDFCNYRTRIGFVEQEPYLMNDTIFNNVKLLAGNSREEDLEAATWMSYVSEFALRKPDGLQSVVGHNGNKLSMGQKQRIALARALLRKPRLLLLDEPLSNVDPISEEFILETIRSLPIDMIVIMVSHKPVPNEIFNKYIVIENGTIVAQTI